jgi:hypothetical protein
LDHHRTVGLARQAGEVVPQASVGIEWQGREPHHRLAERHRQISRDSGEKLRAGSYALLEYTSPDDAQRRVSKRYRRRDAILPAEQFKLAEQRAALLPIDYRPVGLTVLDEDLDLSLENDENTRSIITLMEEMMATPVTPDDGVLE